MNELAPPEKEVIVRYFKSIITGLPNDFMRIDFGGYYVSAQPRPELNTFTLDMYIDDPYCGYSSNNIKSIFELRAFYRFAVRGE